MNAHSANTLFRAINAMRPKQKFRLSLGDWSAATPEQRKAMDVWCATNNYELVIDLNDLGPMNGELDTRDHDKQRERDNQDDYEVFPAQAGE